MIERRQAGKGLATSCLVLLPTLVLIGCLSLSSIVDPFPPAPHPPMGWNSWYAFGPHISDALIREQADAMLANGMRRAGYEYINVSDGWQGSRDSEGFLHPNADFPDMVALGQYLHSRGFKYGIYTSMGPRTCTGYPGSLGYEEQDAHSFLNWGVDLVTYDACQLNGVPLPALEDLAQKSVEAIRANEKHPIILNIILLMSPWQWAPGMTVNMWRIAPDATDTYEDMLQIADTDAPLAGFATQVGWNDPDMLQVGRHGMTTDEYRTHMTLWAMLAAPLVSSTDLHKIHLSDLEILTNPDAIAIDQDPLVKQATRIVQGNADVWVKNLSKGWAIAVVNRSDQPVRYVISSGNLGIRASQALEVWAKQTVALPYTATIQPHACVLLRTL